MSQEINRVSKQEVLPESCVIEVRARIQSFGGLIFLGVCVLVTLIFVFVLLASATTGAQQFITFILFFACWGYFVNSVTERLHLSETTFIFRSFLGRSRNIPLHDLEEMTIQHNGMSLDQGFRSIEIVDKKNHVDRIFLGPCWKRESLDGFIDTLQSILNTK